LFPTFLLSLDIMVRIFVLADTHDKFPPVIVDLVRHGTGSPGRPGGADEIWHLGDVCAEQIVDELRAIGPPVTVVRGNCDSNNNWPLVVDLIRNGLRLRLQHIPPDQPPDDVDVVLHGHTHVPRNEKRNGVLFLNPGCVTRPNRGAAPSVAWLEIFQDGKLNWKLKTLR
jgi:putative phosphoesterase